jgi:transposase InsO family protein
MSYVNPNNKYAPRHRRDVAYKAQKIGIRAASRYYGIPAGTISKWVKKAKRIGLHPIPTKSSRPKSHPKELDEDIVSKIVELRYETKRTSEVIHQILLNEGINVSLSSVHRTLDRKRLLKKRSPYKRTTPHIPRPNILKPGDLVQLDTIHLMTGEKTRIYVMTLIDVYSRNTYAKCYEKINSQRSVDFLNEAEKHSVFDFNMIQTDHGPEFGKWFRERIKRSHRYSRIGKPNDNSHIERFNRTIQEECLDTLPRDVKIINSKLKEYLKYYNEERLHMGINMKTPLQIIRECFQASD